MLGKLMRQMPAMATRNPRKKLPRSFSSSFRKMCVMIPVKKGAADTMTPTLEAEVQVRAMFSSR